VYSSNLLTRPRVGISKCLLGEPVRYDGKHKYNQTIAEELGPYFQWVPVCPEFESGLGIPRETLDLIETTNGLRLIMSTARTDVTPMILKFSDSHIRHLLKNRIHGFIFKARSPSCAVDDALVHRSDNSSEKATGLFASAVLKSFPSLPIEDENYLKQQSVRTKFIERVLAYQKRSSG